MKQPLPQAAPPPAWHTLGKLPAWVWLLLAFGVSVALRLINLQGLPFYWDEPYHTHAALQLMAGETPEYTRGFYHITLPVVASFWAFGVSWFNARLPMVLLNSLAIVPLYWVTRPAGKALAWMAVFLYVLNPWMIGVARNVREYAVLPILHYLALWAAMCLADGQTGVLAAGWRRNWRPLAVAAGLAAFVALVDPGGLSATAIGYFVVLAGYLGFKTMRDGRWFWLAVGTIIFFGLALGIWFFMAGAFKGSQGPELLLRIFEPQIPWAILETFTQNAVQHNYWWPAMGWLVLLLIPAGWVYSLFRLQKPGARLTFLVAGLALLMAFLMLLVRNFPLRVRYGVLFEIGMPILLAVLLAWVGGLAGRLRLPNWVARWLPWALALALFTNVGGLAAIYSFKGGTNFLVTGNSHPRANKAYRYIAERIKPNDMVVADRFMYNDEMNGNQWGQFRRINAANQMRFLDDPLPYRVPNTIRGWVALYPDANLKIHLHMQYRDFVAGNKQFKYHGYMDDVYVWSWTRTDIKRAP